MGCDIHWILERRHQDGAWEAVLNKAWTYSNFFGKHLFKLPQEQYSETMRHPVRRLGERKYTLFSALSQVHTPDGHEYGPSIAIPGMPNNVTDHADIDLPTDDFDVHSHGHFNLETFGRCGMARAPRAKPARRR